MKKRLYKVALLTSPILGLYGGAPAYFLNKVALTYFLGLTGIITVVIFIVWNLNILIVTKVKNSSSWQRYVLSYLSVITFQFSLIKIGTIFQLRPDNINEVYPFIAMLSINSIILFIANFILLQTQKATADQEIELLKVSNLEAQKQVLMQQLQPHFLFNALSTLKSLISENSSVAEDYTLQLSDFLRYSVQAKNQDTIELADEVEFTQNYINLQKVRFGDSLLFSVNIPDNFLSKKVPVYGLQTLVENAIKHNAFSDKKILTINISVENNRIRVHNNRQPKRLLIPSGTGLQNLNKRYQILANKEIEIIADENNFIVYLHILES